MSEVFLLVLLGATVFSEQNIPGLRVEDLNPLSGTYSVNYRHVDLNNDGKMDLILPDRVILQVSGAFDVKNAISIPNKSVFVRTDLFGTSLYQRTEGKLEIFPWQDTHWGLPATMDIEWPDIRTIAQAGEHNGLQPPMRQNLARFLHDMDGDGDPEIIIAHHDGLHIYTLNGNRLKKTARLPLFPPPRATAIGHSAIWPEKSRRIHYPTRRLDFRFFVDGANIVFVYPEPSADGFLRYTIENHLLDPENEYQPLASSSIRTEPLPSYFRPCRLNADLQIDFAGVKRYTANTATFPVPILEVSATLDSGKTLRTVRTKSYRSRCSFVDIDSDGDLDLVSEKTRIFEGGVREALTQFMTRKEIDHQIDIYVHNGTFDSRPAIQHRLRIKLDQFPFRQTEMFDRYQAGELIDITGDFDGDGHNDLLVQDRPDRLAIHFWTGKRFESKPSLIIPIRPHWRFGISDIDQDGRSDIAMRWKSDKDGAIESGLVFFSREDSP